MLCLAVAAKQRARRLKSLFILYSSLYIGIMLVLDILYGILDPRIRVSAKGGDA